MNELLNGLRRFLTTVLLAAVFWPDAPSAQESIETISSGTLTACFPRNAGVIAGRRTSGGSGFDYRIMEEVASKLEVRLAAVWFEPELEEESDPLRDTYAMLSYGLCDVVAGHPRYVRAVGAPRYARASVPRWLGMPREIDPSTGFFRDVPVGFVDLQPIVVTQGYMRSTIALVYRDDTPVPSGLNDLKGRSLALQQGTLAGAIAMAQLGKEDLRRARHFNPGASFLWQVEIEELPVAIVDVVAFDNYRKSNPGTRLAVAGWRHSLGMDIGIALLEKNRSLLAVLERALDEIVTSGVAHSIAASETLTYTPPESRELAQEITMRDLIARP